MDATLIRSRPLAALIVGATGINVLRVVAAFERRRILTVRADDIASACERIVVDMPHVVLVLVPPRSQAERDALADRALAVGALVVEVDPHLDEDTFEKVLEKTVRAALEHKLVRETSEMRPLASGASDAPPPDEIDGGHAMALSRPGPLADRLTAYLVP